MNIQLNKSKYLLPPEYEHLESTLTKFKDKERRDTTMLWLLLHTGARCSELLSVTKQDVYYETESVFLRGVKGSLDREIPLPSWLFKRLALEAKAAIGDRVFPIKYNRLRDIWAAYKPVDKRIHSLRHTFAIRIYERTKDIRLVQRALGHKNIATTQVYSDYCYSQEEFRRLLCQ